MLEILYRLLEGPEIRKKEKSEWQSRRELVMDRDVGRKMRKATEDKEKVKGLRLGKTVAKAKKAFERSDMEFYNAGDLYKISLAAKWCPSLDSSYDKATLMCESVARSVNSPPKREIIPREEYIEYRDIEETHYAYRVRDRLRKDVLVPLHEALELPEVYICAKKWNNLPYNRVPSVAMKLYKKFFYKRDKERFEEYLEKVKSGKSTIAAGALLPHEIIKSLDDETGPEWQSSSGSEWWTTWRRKAS
ncbi:hypothetical protein C3L33_15060, partial [Rhododendron williamsianum]